MHSEFWPRVLIVFHAWQNTIKTSIAFIDKFLFRCFSGIGSILTPGGEEVDSVPVELLDLAGKATRVDGMKKCVLWMIWSERSKEVCVYSIYGV